MYLETTIISETINNFIDRVGEETSNIQQQIYSPVHGLTSEDMKVLANTINYGWLLDFPIIGKRATLYAVAYYAKKRKDFGRLVGKIGGWVLQAVAYVVEGRITQRDLVRIITRHRLIRRLGGLGIGFFTHIADFIANARFPFNRNTLSADNFTTLTAHIAAMFKDNPQFVAEDIAKQVVKLCKKDSDGLLYLDITDYKNNIDIIGEVERLAAAQVGGAASSDPRNVCTLGIPLRAGNTPIGYGAACYAWLRKCVHQQKKHPIKVLF